jgi:hypothetical protein
LRHLNLARTKITDNGLSALGRLTQLESLEMAGTPVTDQGLVHLLPLQQLKRLTLGPHVTKEAAHKLKRSLPQCDVVVFDVNGTSL